MATQKMKSIKGRAVRVTRLDSCGVPVIGPCSSIVTYGFIQVTIGHEYVTGDTYEQKNAWGELCVNDQDPDILKWANLGAQFCEMDPAIMDIIGGANPVIVGDDTIGGTFGPNTPVGAFALEVWTKAAGADACAGGATRWGYAVVPFTKNGRLDGDLTIANAPLNFSYVGKGFGAVAGWGVGPYGDNPLLSTAGFPDDDMWGMVVTTVGPPPPTVGCVALGDIGAIEAGDAYPANAAVTAESDAEGTTLIGLGYVVAPPGTNWATGEFFSIGTFKFNWNGTIWKAGIHA